MAKNTNTVSNNLRPNLMSHVSRRPCQELFARVECAKITRDVTRLSRDQCFQMAKWGAAEIIKTYSPKIATHMMAGRGGERERSRQSC